MNHQYDPNIHHRRSIRLRGYDYSQPGWYFVTICTQNRIHLFGAIIDNEMVLNDTGKMVEQIWNDLPNHYAHVILNEFVVMPNHIHCIIELADNPAPNGLPAPTRHGLPEIIRGFKTFSSRRINELRNRPGNKNWQRNYWEHIIHDENEYHQIIEYIRNNPQTWALDKLNGGIGNQVI